MQSSSATRRPPSTVPYNIVFGNGLCRQTWAYYGNLRRMNYYGIIAHRRLTSLCSVFLDFCLSIATWLRFTGSHRFTNLSFGHLFTFGFACQSRYPHFCLGSRYLFLQQSDALYQMSHILLANFIQNVFVYFRFVNCSANRQPRTPVTMIHQANYFTLAK